MLYYLFWIILKPFAFLRRCEGRENIPRKGPYIVVANHVGDLDSYRIGPHFPFFSVIHWFAKAELYHPERLFDDYYPIVRVRFAARVVCRLVSFIAKHSAAIPVDRANSGARINRVAVITARKLLEAGEIIGIFGEGGTGRHGEVRPIFVGLAKKTGVSILPVRVTEGGIVVAPPVNVTGSDEENARIAQRIFEQIYRL